MKKMYQTAIGHKLIREGTVNVPFWIAADTHLRDVVSNERRHGVEQNRCGLPPLARGSKEVSHQRQSIIAMRSEIRKPPPAFEAGRKQDRNDKQNGQAGDG